MTKKVLTLATFAAFLLSTGSAFSSQLGTPTPTLSQGQLDVPIPIPPQLPGKLDVPLPPPMSLPGV